MNKTLILASASPRRAELLKQIGIEFEIVPSSIKEHNDKNLCPRELVQSLALAKAENVAKKYTDRLILGADTIVCLEDQIIGKPKDPMDAIDILQSLNGRPHKVITGLALVNLKAQKKLVRYGSTMVHFKRVSIEEIKDYVDCGEPLDKAGAYAIQGKGSFLVEKIEGSFSNVVGLPIEILKEMLTEIEYCT